MISIHVIRSVFTTAIAAQLLASCASTGTLPEHETKDYMERLQTRTNGGLQVSTSVLSASESQAIYGVPLASKGIQPVWIEVKNHDDIPYWLLSPGLDPNFFPASEAADAFAPTIDSHTHHELDQHFRQLAFKNTVTPGTTVSGFILTNPNEGVKMVELDLVASGHLKTFYFLSDVPGFRADYAGKEDMDQ